MLLINLIWKNRLIILAAVYFHTVLSFVKIVHYENQSVPEFIVDTSSNVDVMFAKSRPSTVSCAWSCSKADGCVSFCYNQGNNACVGCSKSCRGSNSSDSGKSDNFTCWTAGTNTPRDCQDVLSRNQTATDDVYPITTWAGTTLDVYCIMSKRGGGWTVFLRRFNGEVRFNRTFQEYEAGFGDKAGEHWLGLRYIHEMTATTTPSDIHISTVGGLPLATEKEVYEEWSTFSIGPGPNYTMHLGTLKTFTYDTIEVSARGFNTSNGMGFSTIDADRDNRNNRYTSCSDDHGNGGWWYQRCITGVNPTGIYTTPGTYDKRSMFNTQFLGYVSMREMTLMYRRTIANRNSYVNSP